MADKESEERPRGFRVVDRRHGREEGEAPAEAERPPEAERPAPGPQGPPPAGPERPSGSPLPEVDFSTFVLSLSTSALYHLGLVAEREGQAPPPPNLPMARYTIDLLGMLEAKTRGNLDPEEAHLLQSLLTELRMRFVEVDR